MILILKHYYFESFTALITLLGSIDILGNPIPLINSISDGVVQLVENPISNIEKGPLDFSLSVVYSAS